MSNVKFRKTFLYKAIVFVTVSIFSFSGIEFSYADKEPGIVASIPEIAPISVDEIGVAIDAGTVRSRFSGTSGKTIIHIQDAHCNFEAQSNISRILEQLTREAGVDMISVEGAEGLVDTAWFRAFPDAEIRREVATYFMRKGEITGAEFFSINSDYDGTIFGAETREYYVENLRAFLDVYPYKDPILSYLNGLQGVGERLKSLVYSPELRAFDRTVRQFASKDIELSDYAEYLSSSARDKGIDIKEYRDFGKLIDTLDYEKKIDFDIVDGERTRYIDTLSEMLSREEMTDLVTQSVKFKKGYIKAVDFYTYLRELAREHNIPIIREYPNLFYYYIYSRIYDGIEIEGLFREIDLIVREIKNVLIQNETQRTLAEYSEKVDKLVSLINIEMTNDDYDRFSKYSNAFTIDDVVSFYRSMAGRYNLRYSIDAVPMLVRENLPKMVDFYEIAIRRDEALVENTLRKMEKEGRDRSVLIAGGFHTRGMVNMLERRGVSYVVVTPKITKDVESPYIQVLTNQRTSIEDIITDSAAMPGTQGAGTRGVITDHFKELLAPPIIAGWVVPMAPDEIMETFGALGEEYFVGLTRMGEGLVIDASQMKVQLYVAKAIVELARKEGVEIEIDISAPDMVSLRAQISRLPKIAQWLQDGTLLAAMLRAYSLNYEAIKPSPGSEMEDAVVAKVGDYVRLADSMGFPVTDAKLREIADRGSLGRQAAGVPLTDAENDLVREVLQERFQDRPETIETETRSGVVVQSVEGLVEELMARELPFEKALNIRPSVHDGVRQIILDKNIYEYLDARGYIDRIIAHEDAHMGLRDAQQARSEGRDIPAKYAGLLGRWDVWAMSPLGDSPESQERFLAHEGYSVDDIVREVRLEMISRMLPGVPVAFKATREAEALRVQSARLGEEVSSGVVSHSEQIVMEGILSRDPLQREGLDITGTYDELVVTGAGFVKAPEVTAGREYYVTVEQGEARFKIGDEEQDAMPVTKIEAVDELVQFQKVGAEPLVLRFFYAPTQEEQISYSTIAAVKKHASDYSEDVKPIMVHSPASLFAEDRVGGVNTRSSIQSIFRNLTHPDFRIASYTTLQDLRDTLDDRYTHVLIGSETELQETAQRDPKKAEIMAQMRVLPVPDDAVRNPNIEFRWNFTLEMIGWSVIAGFADPQQVYDYEQGQDLTSPAADMYKFLTQVLRRDIEPRDLYMIFPRLEIESLIRDDKISVDKDFWEDILDQSTNRIVRLVQKILFSMPITPYDPMAALKRRLQVMWSA